jgi:hypothetical protein
MLVVGSVKQSSNRSGNKTPGTFVAILSFVRTPPELTGRAGIG